MLTPEFLHERVGKILDTVSHMSRTIDDFRNFLKPSESIGSFDLVDAIRESLNIMEKQLEHHGIEVRVTTNDPTENAFSYSGNAGVFKQVMINLINNARESIDTRAKQESRKDEIVIEALKSEAAITVRLRDSGTGIAPEVIDTLFDPYVSTKYEQQGTGIGLYMSKMIIERNMKGTLRARNVDGGAEFTIVLPLSEE
jgi:signal transduction histidine kinase